VLVWDPDEEKAPPLERVLVWASALFFCLAAWFAVASFVRWLL
jgi:hypothetical protein